MGADAAPPTINTTMNETKFSFIALLFILMAVVSIVLTISGGPAKTAEFWIIFLLPVWLPAISATALCVGRLMSSIWEETSR